MAEAQSLLIGVGMSMGDTAGTTAVSKGDAGVDVIANDLGERTTPVMVGYDGEQISVGLPASQGMVRNSKNTASSFYSLLGKKFADPTVQASAAACSCAVVDKDGEPWCEPADLAGSPISPTELTSKVVNDLRTTATTQTGALETLDVVFAVPPCATAELKQALQAAAALVGVRIQQFVNEPVAATLGYDIGQGADGSDHTVVVFDLGGSKATASLVLVRNGIYRMLGTVSDAGISGKAFDKALVDYFAKEFKKKFKADITGDEKAVRKLTSAAVSAKKILSTKPSTTISIEALHDGMDFQSKVMRMRIDVSLGKEYRKCTAPIQKLLDECGLKVEDVTDVVLAGGASKMPKIKTTIATFFGNADIVRSSIAPDEVIAIGAAKQAYLLSQMGTTHALKQQMGEKMEQLDLKCSGADVCVKAADGTMQVLIPGGTPVPVARSVIIATSEENQASVLVELFERSKEGEPVALGQATLTELPAGAAGDVKVRVTAQFSKAGELRIQVIEETSGKEVSGTVASA